MDRCGADARQRAGRARSMAHEFASSLLPTLVPLSEPHENNMTKVAILPERSAQGDMEYRAIGSGRQALARTAGAALDALTAQLPADEAGTLVIVQNQLPDGFFNAAQQQRLGELMARWRTARDAGTVLPSAEQAELDGLVEAEVLASGERASAVLAGLAK